MRLSGWLGMSNLRFGSTLTRWQTPHKFARLNTLLGHCSVLNFSSRYNSSTLTLRLDPIAAQTRKFYVPPLSLHSRQSGGRQPTGLV